MYDSDFSNDSMKEMYLFESTTLLDQLDDILLQSEQDKTLFEANINEIFRIMHTIKGSSAMMSYDSIADITHKLEDLFYYIRENNIDSNAIEPIFDLMLNASDYLKNEISKVQSGEPLEANPDLFSRIDNMLTQMANPKQEIAIPVPDTPMPESLRVKDDEPSIVNVEEESKSSTQELREAVSSVMKTLVQNQKIYHLHIYFNEGAAMENVRAFMLVDKLNEIGEVTKMVPNQLKDNAHAAKQIVEDGFYLTLATSLPRKEIETIAKETLSVESVTFVQELPYSPDVAESTPAAETAITPKEVEAQKAEQVVEPTPEDSAPRSAMSKALIPPASRKYLNVDSEKIDSLMDLVGEIVTTESLVTGNPQVELIDDEDFERTKRELKNITTELQDMVMSIRMMSIKTVFNQMKRVVRDISKDLDKEAELVIIGENTEADKTVLEALTDPIIHLVRNAVDHGIETPDVRASLGKDPKGRILLSAQNIGGEILIYISDDGAGIDKNEILRKADIKNILTKDASLYSEKEVYELLTTPGFSMQEDINQYSGRGVGLDVVKSNIEKINGHMRIQSIPGKGTNVQMRIPLTVAIMPCMQVCVNESTFSIPVSSIQETFRISPDQLQNNEYVTLRGNSYEYMKLSEKYNLDPLFDNPLDGVFILTDFGCILADDVTGNKQVVVKPLPAYIESLQTTTLGITGCTIMGDGSISLIIDTKELFS